MELTQVEIDKNRRTFVDGLRENPNNYIFYTGQLVDWSDHNRRCALGLGAELFKVNVFEDDTAYTELSDILDCDTTVVYELNDVLYNDDPNGFKTVADKLEQLWHLS